jgi:hypothetical protein
VTPQAIVRGTMILATLAWAIGEALMRGSPRQDRIARGAWTVGVALALLHVVLAFHVVYGWSHDAAAAATARQAMDRFGWSWRGGVYVNYAFLAMWCADVVWWWVTPASHASRSRALEMARRVFFTFMFINGAIVFASGIGRLVGIASVTLVLLATRPGWRKAVPA